MSDKAIRILFLVAALYDFVLGSAFLFAGPELFNRFSVPPPNHWGYISFCCLMLMIFGLMFLCVAINPRGYRCLIPFGILLKIAYSGIVGFYWATEGVPLAFKPFLVVDVLMLVLFAWAWLSLGKDAPAKS